MKNARTSKIRRLRFTADSLEWFSLARDEKVNQYFWTTLQESFYASYMKKRVRLSDHRYLEFSTLRQAAGDHDIEQYFTHIPGLVHFLTEIRKYVEECVRVFYATLWIAPGKRFIMFMVDGVTYRITRESILELFGFEESFYSLHEVAYPDALPPRRGYAGGGIYPSDEQVAEIFR